MMSAAVVDNKGHRISTTLLHGLENDQLQHRRYASVPKNKHETDKAGNRRAERSRYELVQRDSTCNYQINLLVESLKMTSQQL